MSNSSPLKPVRKISTDQGTRPKRGEDGLPADIVSRKQRIFGGELLDHFLVLVAQILGNDDLDYDKLIAFFARAFDAFAFDAKLRARAGAGGDGHGHGAIQRRDIDF